jgi:hypothetical protein
MCVKLNPNEGQMGVLSKRSNGIRRTVVRPAAATWSRSEFIVLLCVWWWGPGISWVKAQKNRGCDKIIGSFTAQEMKDAGRQFLVPIVDSTLVNNTGNILFFTAQYDVQVRKKTQFFGTFVQAYVLRIRGRSN